jgi:peptide/nickel transport system ATP-binding protein
MRMNLGAFVESLSRTANSSPLLNVKDLRISFRTDEGLITAVDGIDFEIHNGQTLGIVGESGSGKSVSTKAVMQLLPNNALIDPAAEILLQKKDGQLVDVVRLNPRSPEVRRIRGGEIAMIFQEPMASFSPVYTIGNQMREAIRLHRGVKGPEARKIAVDMLDKVGIANPTLCVDQYQHELSGGMRQRAMIAMALSTSPSLLIADEPTTALDVTIQAQILDLMRQLQNELDMSIIFITHDMGVIAQITDEVVVIYLGRVMEYGPTRALIDDPRHPYTKGLLAAIPSVERLRNRLEPIPGDIPSPLERPPGCPFQTRCPERIKDLCESEEPGIYRIDNRRTVSCFLYSEHVR